MRKNRVSSPDFSETWRKAGDRLANSGNRLSLIGALVTMLPLFLLYVVISMTFDAVVFLLYEQSPVSEALPVMLLYDLALILLTLFFVMPLTVGFFRMCHRTVHGQRVRIADLFSVFESRACYRHSLSLSFDLLWRALILIAVATLTCQVAVTWYGNGIAVGLLCGLVVLLEVAVGLSLILRRFAVWAIAIDRDVSRAKAARVSKKIARHTRMSGILFLLNMVPRILLGLLTFGIFLIWEVLPRMCVAYFLYCNQLSENIDHLSEEYKNE